MRYLMFGLGLVSFFFFTGCKKEVASNDGSQTVFVLAWSEYPSSAAFGVAQETALDGSPKVDENHPSVIDALAKKWNIKVKLVQTDYDTLVTMYGSNKADAVCITNMDALPPCLTRPAVAVLPVSTSFGGDAVVVSPSIKTVDDLKGKPTKGLEQSVSQYMFERNLELLGKNVAEYPYSNLDPASASQAIQTKQNGIDSVAIWNPFIMQTLKTRPDTHVLFSSKAIPEEIVDIVCAGKDSLSRPGGDRFGAFICDVYYTMNRKLASSTEGEKTTVALGAKFSNLNLQEMQQTLIDTLFYKSPEEAVKLLEGDHYRKEVMPRVVAWTVLHMKLGKTPKVGYDDVNADLNWSTVYIKMVEANP